MSNYEDYADRFLAALYLETEETGQEFHSVRSIHEKYGFSPEKSHWINRMADDWEYQYFKDVSKVLSGYDGWDFRLSPDGYRKVESEFLNTEEIRDFLSPKPSEEDGVSTKNVKKFAEAQSVPAANRLVRLDHNQPEYLEIRKGLDELFEQVRQDNEVGETAGDRDRILRSLSAAKELWSATELYTIQIQVGIVMAVDDATTALTRLGKAVGAALLVDLIKKLIKNSTGIDI